MLVVAGRRVTHEGRGATLEVTHGADPRDPTGLTLRPRVRSPQGPSCAWVTPHSWMGLVTLGGGEIILGFFFGAVHWSYKKIDHKIGLTRTGSQGREQYYRSLDAWISLSPFPS